MEAPKQPESCTVTAAEHFTNGPCQGCSGEPTIIQNDSKGRCSHWQQDKGCISCTVFKTYWPAWYVKLSASGQEMEAFWWDGSKDRFFLRGGAWQKDMSKYTI